MSERVGIDPLVKQVTVPGTAEAVFELFTSRIDEWWPRVSHSVAGEDAVSVRMGSGAGARIFEVTGDGTEHEWGRITDWVPGERVAFSWRPGLATEQATHVEITFRSTAEGIEVTLVHDGWEARGEGAREMRDNYDTGWDLVLGRIPGSIPVELRTSP
jgi:uncharacterized protein YndB with AHSA1/START domain